MHASQWLSLADASDGLSLAGVSERANSRLSNASSRDSDVPDSPKATPTRHPKPEAASNGQGKAHFFDTLEWNEEGLSAQEGAAPAIRTEQQV